jgi:hypothetical protein
MTLTHHRSLFVLALVTAACVAAAVAAPAVPAAPDSQPSNMPTATRPAAKNPAGPKPPPRHQQIDHGPFVTATIPTQWPEGGIVNKAVAVRLKEWTAPGTVSPVGGVLFDTDTCTTVAGWSTSTGWKPSKAAYVEFSKDWTSVRDARSVKLTGTQVFGTKGGPGWAKPGAGGGEAWKDPRPAGFGPLPRDWVKYRGLYRAGDEVVFSYSVGQRDVLEAFAYDCLEVQNVTVRVIEVGPGTQPLTLLVAEREGATAAVRGGFVTLDKPGGPESRLRVHASSVPSDARWAVGGEAGNGRVLLNVPARDSATEVRLFYWTEPEPHEPPAAPDWGIAASAKEHAADAKPFTLSGLRRGGPALWPQVITTAGVLGQPKPDAPYAVDTITLPDDNPWHSWMRPGGFDFFTSDPTKAAVCNWSGDVWTVSGLTGDLKELKWRRFASGLFQPLGLRIVNDQVYVLGRDQVTRLVDLNGDGEADFYENFNNDVQVTPNFHEFAFDLQTDPAGNFYFAKAGPVKNGGQGFDQVARDHGSILKLSPDGRTLGTYATGFRAPNGIGVGPDGQVTAGDNEGTYVPKCRIAWVKPGGFYGVVPTSHRDPPPTDYDRPLCWMPKNVDNSSGGQVWVTTDKWGDALKGRLLHLSYGTCSLFLVSKEEVPADADAAVGLGGTGPSLAQGLVQGGVIRLPLSFDSGIMRARFSPADGQLYVAGLKGWQTSAGKDGCFQRVRYTGKPVKMPTDVKATKAGLTLTFSCPLDKADANDPESFSVERWNYVWKDAYGSPDVSVADPTKGTHDPVKVRSATLQPDGRTVVLEIPDMRPAMQYKTEVNLRSADGADVRYEVYHTVHALR